MRGPNCNGGHNCNATAMDVCLRVLKESNKSRFESCSVRNSELIVSHIIFRDCRVHIFFFATTFLEIAVYTNSLQSATLRPFPDYDKLPVYHYLRVPLSATSFDGCEPDDFQPRAEMKRMFQNYIVPPKFGRDSVDHLA